MLSKNDRLWTVADVQKVIPLSSSRVRQIIHSLPHVTFGGKLMIEPQYIERWINAHRVYPDPPKEAKGKPPKLAAVSPYEGLEYRHSRR